MTVKLLTPQGVALKLVRARYAALKRRMASKGMEPAFTVGDFVNWHVELLGPELADTCRCIYCNCLLDISTLRAEHRVPIARGGSAKMNNLGPSCDRCNNRKGRTPPRLGPSAVGRSTVIKTCNL